MQIYKQQINTGGRHASGRTSGGIRVVIFSKFLLVTITKLRTFCLYRKICQCHNCHCTILLITMLNKVSFYYAYFTECNKIHKFKKRLSL